MQGIMSETFQNKKTHPHKFALWIGIASIAMMFAGLTSAYIVRQAQGNWRTYDLPFVFWISTIVIILSSITMIFGIKAFKNRQMPQYKMLITITLLLGLAFGILQFTGFYQLYQQPQTVIFDGEIQYVKDGNLNRENIYPVKLDGNPSESFLFIIAGLHLLHILGGVVALAIVYFKAFRKHIKVYSTTGLEIIGTYWHFVDILWIYLFIFFLVNQ